MNHRSQGCDVLTGTGISRRGKNGARLWSQTQLQRFGNTGRAATGASHTVALQEMDGHEGGAPSIPVWKTSVCLSTPMPGIQTANHAKYAKEKSLFACFVYFAVNDSGFNSALRIPNSALETGIPCWNRTSLCGFAGRRLSCSANGI
ncbi:MAG: hypothetical protein EPO07_20150 [Verrucomicrobia bacterium]|nr:MAG: hypothetical protein EPO07_20150 [Verrucomicrobiota bacterium]